MFLDLIDLFSGWYQSYVQDIKVLLELGPVEDPFLPEIWSAFVPWEALIAAVVLIVTICCVFRLLRSVLCKIL